MNAFTKKTLFAAIAGASVLGASGAAQAVSVSPTGMGEVLVYPFYTVKGSTGGVPYNTLLSIVNSTDSTKAVKIRFREGKASAEVLDFNIFLSPYDVWTASLEPAKAPKVGVTLYTADTTCTVPTIPATGVDFRNFDYIGDNAKDDAFTRLQEGYFEVFEMATYSSATTLAISAKHGANGVPAACSKITDQLARLNQGPVTGGLSGTVSLVEPAVTGANIAVNATALRFMTNSGYADTGSETPTFINGELYSVTPTNGGNVVHATWDDSVDATSAAIMKTALINEFVLDTATNSATAWVVTMPTKHFYVPRTGSGAALPPFTNKLSATGSCDVVTVETWNREEQGIVPGGPDFSPSPEADKVSLCWEANVITFNSKAIAGSTNTLSITTAFQNGWMMVGFPASEHKLTANAATYVTLNGASVSSAAAETTFTGLPVIGYMAQTFRPAASTSYAGTFDHKFMSGAPAKSAP